MGDFPNLGTYVARGEAGLAFARGFDARLARFVASTADGWSVIWTVTFRIDWGVPGLGW